jgi:hypothetical protein
VGLSHTACPSAPTIPRGSGRNCWEIKRDGMQWTVYVIKGEGPSRRFPNLL